MIIIPIMCYYTTYIRYLSEMKINSFFRKSFSWKVSVTIIFVSLLGIFFSINSIIYADKEFRNSLLDRTKIISHIFDINSIESLSASELDFKNTNYIKIKSELSALSKINSETRFVYLAGYNGKDVFFFADSEPDGSSESSPPGQIYDEASPTFIKTFVSKTNEIDGPTRDRWGVWISSLSPILDPETGNVVAVVGIDINARSYYITLALYGSIPILISLILSIFVFLIYRENKKEYDSLSFRSELVSIAAHDLRGPIVGMRWLLDSLLEERNSNISADQRNSLELMHKSSGELLKTTNEILDASKMDKQSEELKLENNNLRQIIDDSITQFSISAKERGIGIKIEDSFPSELSILCDRPKIKRVFSNLISNAIKYSEKGKEINIFYGSNDKNHIITITDHGVGIPLDEQKSLFQEFYRTKNALKMSYGVGLGLYYVKKVVEQHNGHIWFDSKEDIGTSFNIELPKK